MKFQVDHYYKVKTRFGSGIMFIKVHSILEQDYIVVNTFISYNKDMDKCSAEEYTSTLNIYNDILDSKELTEEEMKQELFIAKL